MRYAFLFLSTLLITGCESDNADELMEEDVRCVIDHAHASMVVLPVYPLVRALQGGSASWSTLGTRTCAVVDSIVGDTTTFPNGGAVTVYLRYPDGGCTDVDGRNREGSMVVVLLSAIGAESGSFSAFSSNFEVSGFKGRFGLHGSANGTVQEVEVDSSFIWQAGAWSRRFSGAMAYSIVSGSLTHEPDDDEYTLTHTLSGKDRNGASYTANTSEALSIGTTCRWTVAGKEIIIPDGLGQRILDHGTGACDGASSISAGDQTIGLTIP
jgi:hypothetical protein